MTSIAVFRGVTGNTFGVKLCGYLEVIIQLYY